MSLLNLGPVIFWGNGQITWFQTKILLSRQVTCPSGKILVAQATLIANKKKGIMSLLDLGAVMFWGH